MFSESVSAYEYVHLIKKNNKCVNLSNNPKNFYFTHKSIKLYYFRPCMSSLNVNNAENIYIFNYIE